MVKLWTVFVHIPCTEVQTFSCSSETLWLGNELILYSTRKSNDYTLFYSNGYTLFYPSHRVLRLYAWKLYLWKKHSNLTLHALKHDMQQNTLAKISSLYLKYHHRATEWHALYTLHIHALDDESKDAHLQMDSSLVWFHHHHAWPSSPWVTGDSLDGSLKSIGSSTGASSNSELKKRWNGTATRDPMNGPTMKTQKVPGHVPETIAGPRERAGLHMAKSLHTS